jgi:8-amino-7-oxononanoate synthase
MDLFDKCREYRIPQQLKEMGLFAYFRVMEAAQEPEMLIEGRRRIMVGSNNYLGLANHPEVKEAAIAAIRKYGTGTAGSRFLNGTLDLHVELEEKLAKFFRKDGAVVFPTGYQTNLGIISSVVTKGEYIVTDRMDHASIVDACRLSFGETLKFRHQNMEDLERILVKLDGKPALIVVDGVFSMEGDITNLPEIVALAAKYGARIMVDDAHGVGVLGKGGRGTGEHFGLEDKVDIIMGTYSKSLASVGGFVAADADVINWIKHVSRPLLFSASLPPASAATVIAALEIIEREPERLEKLWRNARKMLDGFRSIGFDTGVAETPIIPVLIGDDMTCFTFWTKLFEAGIYANPVVSPAVPPGRAMIRTSYMSSHEDQQLDHVLEVFERIAKEMGILTSDGGRTTSAAGIDQYS